MKQSRCHHICVVSLKHLCCFLCVDFTGPGETRRSLTVYTANERQFNLVKLKALAVFLDNSLENTLQLLYHQDSDEKFMTTCSTKNY